jgi:hypothetical protein
MPSIERLPRSRSEDQPQPFRREALIEGNTFLRLITARTVAAVSKQPLSVVARTYWPNDGVIDLVVRAASAPAQTTVTGWAAELAQKLVADAVAGLGPMSAGVQLLRGGIVLTFDNHGSISVPGFAASAASAGFVAEGAPIPVRQLSAAAAQLLPYKLASIAALTEEMINSSNAEALIGDALMRSAGAALDQALFDANAATAARPAGLRNGIAALTASNSTDLIEAAYEDFVTLVNGAAQVGGPGPYVLVASPGRAMSIRSRISAYRENLQLTMIGDVLGTPAMGSDLMVVAASALVSAFDPDPEIEANNAATLVMDDTSPSTPDTTQPTKSLFQTASVAVKMRWPVSWAIRDSRGVAWLTPAWK